MDAADCRAIGEVAKPVAIECAKNLPTPSSVMPASTSASDVPTSRGRVGVSGDFLESTRGHSRH